MRKDMKDLIVNTGRHGGGGKNESRRARMKRMDADDLPSRLPIARRRQFGWDAKELGDRLSPLDGFLEANIGRQWDDVYSEICEHADPRTTRGYHLRQHVWNAVVPNNYDVGHRRRYGPFFVHTDGTLQHEKPYVRARYRNPNETPYVRVDEDHRYMKEKGFWYFYETKHYTEPNSREDLVQEYNEIKIVRIVLPDVKRHVTTKHQVTGEMQKYLDDLYYGK